VLNRHGDVSTTAVTNVDLHDLARAGRTFGVERFFVVTPITLQQELVGRVIHHWTLGTGAARNCSRAQAFGRVEVVADLDTVMNRIDELKGQRPILTVSGAGLHTGTTPYSEVRGLIETNDRPLLFLLGTGHGLAPAVMEQADIRLPAIVGPEEAEGYNHLSVRSAAVIILDRLRGNTE
jgi:hypothetical protein